METLEIIEAEEKVQNEVYKMNFAPHIGLTSPNDGMFIHHAGTDPVDQIKFIADQGFRAIEDNFLKMRPIAEQERIAKELELYDMSMGVFVHNLDSWQEAVFVSDPRDSRDRLIREVRSTIETAKRVNGKWATLLSGQLNPGLERSYQKANMIENLKSIAEIAEKSGVTLAIEAINSREFPGTFLTKVTEVYEIVKAVNSPSVKVMFDMYHVQIELGDVIRHLDQTWDEIAYVQLADNPGRSEPGTGEINFINILRHLQNKGYHGPVDMEHVNSIPGKAGEQAVLDIYKHISDQL